MDLNINILLLLVVVASCQCKPAHWGFGARGKGHIGVGADGKADAAVGVKDWQLGGKGNVKGGVHTDADGTMSSYAYVASSNKDETEARGFGVYHDMTGAVGVKLEGDASGNGAIGKGQGIGLKTGGSATGNFNPEGYVNLDGDTHAMSGSELKNMANRYDQLNGKQLLNPRVTTTTESFF